MVVFPSPSLAVDFALEFVKKGQQLSVKFGAHPQLKFRLGIVTGQVVIDDQHEIQESDKTNNIFKVTVMVKGSCAGAETMPSQPAKVKQLKKPNRSTLRDFRRLPFG